MEDKLFEAQVTFELPSSPRKSRFEHVSEDYLETVTEFFGTRLQAEEFIEKMKSKSILVRNVLEDGTLTPIKKKAFYDSVIAEMPYDWYSKLITLDAYEKITGIELKNIHRCKDCKHWREDWKEGIHFINYDRCDLNHPEASSSRISNCRYFEWATDKDVPYSKECKWHSHEWCLYDESNVAGYPCRKDICPILNPELSVKKPPIRVDKDKNI